MGFEPRLTEPSRDNQYYFGGNNIFETAGYGMPNCTAYAFGRAYEITGKTFEALRSNAEDWWEAAKAAGYSVGSEPKLGAIICWKAGNLYDESDGAGHVAVVEEIDSNGDIMTSNSGWQGSFFFTRKVTKASGYQYASNRQFQGFIYTGDFGGTTTTTTTNTTNTATGGGQSIALSDTPVYANSGDASIGNRTGNYYLWSDEVVNGRVRVTNDPNRVGVSGQVSFWIDQSALSGTTTTVVADTTTSSGSIAVGSNVTINQGAADYTGTAMASFVYGRTNKVIDITDDRVVVTYDGVIVGAFHKADLTVV